MCASKLQVTFLACISSFCLDFSSQGEEVAANLQLLTAQFDVIFKKTTQAADHLWRPVCPLLSSSMAEHSAVNRRVVGSSPT
jgi:hypothetical protein